MNRILAAGAALVLSVSACKRGPADSSQTAATAAGSPAAATSAFAYVSAATALRREPTDAARVRNPAGKEVSNTLTVLQRGERLSIVEAKEDLARVRSSDDREGWVRRSALVEGDGISEATVLQPADVFDRPDLLAANARRKIDAGTLLLVVKTKPPFSEVNVGSGPDAWVLSERLASGEKEVSVAKLAEKARWLKRSGKEDDARQILALARQSFPGVPLVDALAVELGEAPPSGETVPAAGAPSAQ